MDNTYPITMPRPDPTELTTQMVLREVDTLEDKMNSAINTLKELNESRLLDAASLRDEKFRAIDKTFLAAENLRIEQKGDSKTGLDAALAAQKEAASEQNKSNTLAISKSEMATTETINKLAELFKTTTDGIIQQITDVKDRITKTEAVKVGATEERTKNVQSISAVQGIFAIVATIITITITVFGTLLASGAIGK